MMRYYNKDAIFLFFVSPSIKLFILGGALGSLSGISYISGRGLLNLPQSYFLNREIFSSVGKMFENAGIVLGVVGCTVLLIGIILSLKLSDASKIRYAVFKGLFYYPLGNPLNMKDGERLPAVKVEETGKGVFELVLTAAACTVEELQGISGCISSILDKKFSSYAVTMVDTDVALNHVKFRIENVASHKEIVAGSVRDLKQDDPARIMVQQNTYIDLTTSGSMLVAGKTRSGKTTGIISMLLQALQHGRDEYDSEIIIIDPKKAELSRLPHTVTLDEDGGGKAILDAMRRFADTITNRQKILNDLSEKEGDAVKWWDAGFHVSVLFIDEYVSMRTIFPVKPAKDAPDYCLATFDGLLKRIVTMGASAGCYAIISIAEASVSEGGLPAMLRSAMSTRILFRPTMTEGALMWERGKLENIPERVYNAGDAWFSSTDGKHDNVTFVHFPLMEFPVYKELEKLLRAYYKGEPHRTPGEA